MNKTKQDNRYVRVVADYNETKSNKYIEIDICCSVIK